MLKHKFILAVSVLFANVAFGQTAKITLSNKIALERKDELIVLKKSFLEKKLNKDINDKNFSIKTNTNQAVALQFDDLNNDGIWDEVAFLQSFLPKEKLNLNVVYGEKAIHKMLVKAHVRQKRKNSDDTFGVSLIKDAVPAGQANTDFSKQKLPPFLTEGPAWENDKLGFRIYMDMRNIKDIWGKTTTDMVLDTVGVNPKYSYHSLNKWGMDILAVGKSLGAGSLALKVRNNGKDTLVRLGNLNMGKMEYEKVSDGPIRAIFRLKYPEWNVLGDGKLTSLIEEISISAGNYFYSSNVTIQNAPLKSELIVGIVNLKSKKSEQLNDKKSSVLFTHDTQSENNDYLGMAVLTSKAKTIKYGQTSNTQGDIRNTYTTALKLDNIQYKFYANWGKTNSKFNNKSYYEEYLKTELLKNSNSITVK